MCAADFTTAIISIIKAEVYDGHTCLSNHFQLFVQHALCIRRIIIFYLYCCTRKTMANSMFRVRYQLIILAFGIFTLVHFHVNSYFSKFFPSKRIGTECRLKITSKMRLHIILVTKNEIITAIRLLKKGEKLRYCKQKLNGGEKKFNENNVCEAAGNFNRLFSFTHQLH